MSKSSQQHFQINIFPAIFCSFSRYLSEAIPCVYSFVFLSINIYHSGFIEEFAAFWCFFLFCFFPVYFSGNSVAVLIFILSLISVLFVSITANTPPS